MEFIFRLCKVRAVAITRPIPVRLDDDLIHRLDRAAERLGNTRAGVIKLCLAAFLDHFENAGGVASLPLNWRDLVAANDGRTRQGKESKSRVYPPLSANALQLNETVTTLPPNSQHKKRSSK